MKKKLSLALMLAVFVATPAAAQQVQVTIENLAPANGTYFTPVWVGFHNGGFDTYDTGSPALPYLERLAEDGNAQPLNDLFQLATAGSGVSDIIPSPGGAFAPGDMATSMTYDLDPVANKYLNFASMIIPSNDAFIGNDGSMDLQIFADDGSFMGTDIFIIGSMIMDAGTEMNTEIPEYTAFLGQMAPNMGPSENGMIHPHEGFIPGGNILSNPDFANADFTRYGYPVAQLKVEAVPLPASVWLLGVGMAGLLGMRRKKA